MPRANHHHTPADASPGEELADAHGALQRGSDGQPLRPRSPPKGARRGSLPDGTEGPALPTVGRHAKLSKDAAARASNAYEDDVQHSRSDPARDDAKDDRGRSRANSGRVSVGGKNRKPRPNRDDWSKKDGRRPVSPSPRPAPCASRRCSCMVLTLFVVASAGVNGVVMQPMSQIVDSYRTGAADILHRLQKSSTEPPAARADVVKDKPVAASQAAPPPHRLRGAAAERQVKHEPVVTQQTAAVQTEVAQEVPVTVPPTPSPDTPAPVTPEPVAEQIDLADLQTKVMDELSSFYIGIGNREKAGRAPLLVRKWHEDPGRLYAALIKHYPNHVQKFAETKRWADYVSARPKAAPAGPPPPPPTPPKPKWKRPEIGDVVTLAKLAREDGNLRRCEMGIVVADERDRQPFKVKNRAGVMFWYAEEEVKPASPNDAQRFTSGEDTISDCSVSKHPPAGGGRAPPPQDRARRAEAKEGGEAQLHEGQRVAAAKDIVVGGTVIAHAGSTGTVLTRQGEKWKVKFVGEFGVQQPVVVPVAGSDVRPI
eukprot:TRINITY_DN3436_c0_g1_i1.p1 TRINITY_DN3436_c0_g1~~TRINITY_DN3436_c0_g1_i1.p1  ORF type:complete len:540 (+),score=118.23 TRINITY_DN3436_c0_g1_i1:102-1721(+)